jgi:hypothetical protein
MLPHTIAAAYVYLKSTRGRAYANQVGIRFWRLRQTCQYDTGCIREVQVRAIGAYQAAGAPIVMPRPSMTAAFETTNSQTNPFVELRLCRNSNDTANKIRHCSNVIAYSSNVSALVPHTIPVGSFSQMPANSARWSTTSHSLSSMSRKLKASTTTAKTPTSKRALPEVELRVPCSGARNSRSLNSCLAKM